MTNPMNASENPQSRTVADIIIEQLRIWGVTCIYGIIGDSILGLMDAIAKQNAIKFIAVKHESTAAIMACTEARLTGSLGVCIATSGPGLANMINGLAEAQMGHYPVIAITGQVPLSKMGTHYKQYIDQQQLIQSVSSYSCLVAHPDAIVEVLTNAIHASLTGSTVTHLSIPEDLFMMKTGSVPRPQIHFAKSSLDKNEIREAVIQMKYAKRPLIMVGSNVRSCSSEIVRLSEHWGAAIVHAYGAIGSIPDGIPTMLGGVGESGNKFATDLFKQADVVLQIGTNWWPELNLTDQAKVILIHSSNQHLNLSVPLDLGLIGRIPEIVSLLTEEFAAEVYQTNIEWMSQVHKAKQMWITLNEKERNISEFPLYPSRIVKAIETIISEDAIIALDIGDSNLWFGRNFRAKHQDVLVSNQWRTMGFGLPAALAAKYSMPNRQVVCIVGDGGLEMVLAELLTAVRYKLNISLILFNNGSLQMEADKMRMKGLVPFGYDLTNPDFVTLAESCGWTAVRMNLFDEPEIVFNQALDSLKPVFIEVPTSRTPYPDFIKDSEGAT